MLGYKHQSQLPQQYLSARARRSKTWRWIRRAGFLPLLVFIFYFFVFKRQTISPVYFYFIWLFVSTVLCQRLLVRRMLGKRRGRVCPCCWRSSDKPKPGCAGCQPPDGVYDHRVYWRLCRFHLISATQWFGDQFRAIDRPAPWTRAILLHALLAFLPLLLAPVYIAVMAFVFHDLSWFGGLGFASWTWFLILPLTFVSIVYARRRAGKTRHCAKCEYQLAPTGPSSQYCPECGNDFNTPGAILTGKPLGNRWLQYGWIPIFFLFMNLPMLFLMLGSGRGLSVYTLFPTDTLIDYVVSEEDPYYQVERELEARRLGDSQITTLIDEIERRLDAGQDLGHDGDPNLWGHKVSGLITEEAGRRTLPHDIEFRLISLRLHHAERYPLKLEIWVHDAIDRGVFSPADFQALHEQVPGEAWFDEDDYFLYKYAPTDALVDYIISVEEINRSARSLMYSTGLNNEQIHKLLDELERRLESGIDMGVGGAPQDWGMQVTRFIDEQTEVRRLPHDIELRMLDIAACFGERCPLRLLLAVEELVSMHDAFTPEELEAAGYESRYPSR